jgi:hypothetical protein
LEPITPSRFSEWKQHPVTKQLFKLLEAERETMKEGLANNSFDNEQEVKGRCTAIKLILSLEYQDLFPNTQVPTIEEENDY